MTQVAEVMTRGVRSMTINESVMQAAQAMDELDIGALPVCDGTTLVGMVTDRDIVLRAVAQGRAAESTRLDEVMSRGVCWCYEDQSVETAAKEMRSSQIRCVPVMDRQKRLVGMLALGDVATKESDVTAGSALGAISEPSRPDRSNQSAASGAAGGGGRG